MKSFIATLIIFVLLLVIIVFNFFYINRVGDNMTEMVNALEFYDSTGCKAGLERLYGYWKDNEAKVSLSVSYIELNSVDDNMTKMISYFECDDRTEFECSRASLLNAIEEMRRLEAFSIKNIL